MTTHSELAAAGTGKNQRHLGYQERVNLGSYYTEQRFVDIVWRMAAPYLREDSVVLDSSCGYGNFLREEMPHRQVGGDLDGAAIARAGKTIDGKATAGKKNNVAFYAANALSEVNRDRYRIAPDAHLCVIGNPPYNDRTSIIRRKIKRDPAPIDSDIATRDAGMSFLLSYQKLRADVVCVLHPLSYLIKRANFNLIRKFTGRYKLVDGKIISSGVFKEASKSMQFPIVIALYIKSSAGFDYEDVLNFHFEVVGGGAFTLSRFDDISRYARKYPNKRQRPTGDDILFWTLRDINALKRNRTFVNRYSANTIIVDRRQLDYYVYIDVFKQFARHVPYYFGNCDVLIDDDLFSRYRKHFVLECLSRHKSLRPRFPEDGWKSAEAVALAEQNIRQYMQRLLGAHYVH